MTEISIKSIGPIKRLTIPLPKDGGVVVLSGTHGAGKSTALAAIAQATGGRKSPNVTVNDFAKNGEVAIGDCTLKVSRGRSARSGELEIESMESRLDISGLVDPGLQDQEAADAKRIKALVAMTGVKADVSAFYDLVGGEEKFKQLEIDTETDDPIVLAARVKKGLEAMARRYEKRADELKGQIVSVVGESMEVIEIEVPDQASLQSMLDAAQKRLIELEHQQKQFEEQSQSIAKAKAELESLGDSASVVDLQAKLEKEKSITERFRLQYEAAKQKMRETELALDSARELEKQRASSLSVLESIRVQPAGDDLQTARDDVAQFQSELAEAAVIAEKAKNVHACKEAKAKMHHSLDRAEAIRALAKRTNEVLTLLIPLGALRISDGRLVTKTDRSDEELYCELSDGERWRLAIDLAADNLPEGGLIVIPQIAWEGLLPSVQQEICSHAKRRKVVILTAQVEEGPLTIKSLE